MKALLDTHAMLWFVLNDARLSEPARLFMMDRGNDLLVSPATFWEIAIKISLQKYQLQEDFMQFFSQQLAENDFVLLPIALEHAAAVSQLPFHHRDPFDRMLIAQALSERIPIISADDALDSYSVTRIW